MAVVAGASAKAAPRTPAIAIAEAPYLREVFLLDMSVSLWFVVNENALTRATIGTILAQAEGFWCDVFAKVEKSRVFYRFGVRDSRFLL